MNRTVMPLARQAAACPHGARAAVPIRRAGGPSIAAATVAAH